METALLIITNTSTGTCRLRGYPQVQLLRNGQNLGAPSTHGSKPTQVVTLHSGGNAQVRLTATTRCQAPLSDRVRVRLPDVSGAFSTRLELRGCTLRTGAVEGA